MEDELFDNLSYSAKPIFEHFYPCIKYKIKADEEIHGTNSFTVAESVHTVSDYIKFQNGISYAKIECNLSITCENHRKVFYKLIKGCSKLKKFENGSVVLIMIIMILKYEI